MGCFCKTETRVAATIPVSTLQPSAYSSAKGRIIFLSLPLKSKMLRFSPIKLLLGTLFLLTIVLPNAFKAVAAGALMTTALVAVLSRGVSKHSFPFFKYLSASVAITVVYLMVGLHNGATKVSLVQNVLVYIVSPILWGLVINFLLLRYGLSTIIKWLIVSLTLCILSIAYYFWAYFHLGPQAVTFMVEEPNINISDEGFSGAVMYVYGSMIFLVGGLFANPKVIKNPLLRTAIMLFAAVASLSSGRSALILSIAVGIFINYFSDFFKGGGLAMFRKMGQGVIRVAFAAAALALVVLIFQQVFNIDFTIAIGDLIEKLKNRGGEGRNEQSFALLSGINENTALGSGHGIGVLYRVSENYPWRYEMVWLASLYRVGIFGAAVYAAPFIVILIKVGRLLVIGKLNDHEKFLYGAFVCAFIGSNTNPYIEGIVFQWMYVLPLMYFLVKRRSSWPVFQTQVHKGKRSFLPKFGGRKRRPRPIMQPYQDQAGMPSSQLGTNNILGPRP